MERLEKEHGYTPNAKLEEYLRTHKTHPEYRKVLQTLGVSSQKEVTVDPSVVTFDSEKRYYRGRPEKPAEVDATLNSFQD